MFFGKRGETRSQNLGSSSNNVSLAIINGQLTPTTSSISNESAIKNSDIFSCINTISSDISGCPFEIKGSDNLKLLYLLNRKPNHVSNANTFWGTILVNLLFNGNTYCPIYRDPKNNPVKLEFVKNEEVNVLLSDDSQTVAYEFNFSDNRDPIVLQSEDVLHFRLLSTDGIMGVSPLISLVDEVNLQNRTNTMTMNSLNQSINPGGILTINEGVLDAEAKENIRKAFEKANGGSNEGRTIVLDNLTTYQSSSINADALKVLIEGTAFTKEQITKAFAIPSDILNQESSHSNIEQILGLYKMCLKRYTTTLNSELTSKLCLDNETIDIDISQVGKYMNKSDDDKESMTINERREKQGLKPIMGGDAIYLPATNIPAIDVNEDQGDM